MRDHSFHLRTTFSFSFHICINKPKDLFSFVSHTNITNSSSPNKNHQSQKTKQKHNREYKQKEMTKVHPKFPNTCDESLCDSKAAVVLTVWKKSLLFNCDGFTVYNANGELVFRVDNYMNCPRDNIVLMDASGFPLLSIRRKVLFLLLFSVFFSLIVMKLILSILACIDLNRS